MYPVWNPSIAYFRLSDNILRVGMDENAWDVNDKSGLWEKFITMCDGEKSDSEIKKSFYNDYNVDAKIIEDGIELFCSKGAMFLLADKLSNNKLYQKYKTNILYFHSENVDGFKLQEKLTNLNVAILGLGGGGFTFFTHLVALGVKNFVLIDYDKIEFDNINRQLLWGVNDIDKFKVDLAEEYALTKDPDIKIEKKYIKVEKITDVISNIRQCDWVFSCMDDPPYKLQRVINRACIMAKKPVVFCFCQKNTGRYFFVDQHTGCVDCLFQSIMNYKNLEFMSAFYNAEHKPSTALTAHNLASLCSVVIDDWLKLLLNNKKITSKNIVNKIDLQTLDVSSSVKWKKHSDCVTCGDQTVDKWYLNKFFQLVDIV